MTWILSMMMAAILFIISFVIIMYSSLIAQSYPVALTFTLLIIGMVAVTMIIHEELFPKEKKKTKKRVAKRGTNNGKRQNPRV